MTTRKILIRDEAKCDAAVITEVTVAAFESMEISNHTEQFIIEALRSARALTLSLVAEVDGRVVGHIAFSPEKWGRFHFSLLSPKINRTVPFVTLLNYID
jgi:putative acetyltransferase